MTFDELKKSLETLNLVLVNVGEYSVVGNAKRKFVAKVSNGDEFYLNTDYDAFADLDMKKRSYLFNYLSEYLNTPTTEKELPVKKSVKKYNVIAYSVMTGSLQNLKQVTWNYYRTNDGMLSTWTDEMNNDPRQQWTLKQIEDWGLENCERVEVK